MGFREGARGASVPASDALYCYFGDQLGQTPFPYKMLDGAAGVLPVRLRSRAPAHRVKSRLKFNDHFLLGLSGELR